MAAAGNAGEAVYVEDVFSAYLYEGTNTSTAHQIQNGIDLDGKGGLVWIKKRDSNIANTNHHLVDTERGDYYLASNSTNAQSAGSDINTFNTDGWTFDASTGLGTDYLGSDYASWTFRKAEKFFDVVTYTGDNNTNRAVPHSLGSVPAVIIIKSTSSATAGTENWSVYHSSVWDTSNYNSLRLNSTAAANGWNAFYGVSEPTSDNFYVRSNGANTTGETYVAYLFASDAGGFGDDGSESIIKCGTFTTDGSGNATIDLGWEPQYMLYKQADGTGWWHVIDTARAWTNPASNGLLYPNDIAAESVGGGGAALNATGFSFANGSTLNSDYIYIAIRRPMKTPESGTEVFSPYAYQDTTLTSGSGTASNRTILNGGVNGGTNFPVDLFMGVNRTGNHPYALHVFDRLRGKGKSLLTNATTAEPAGDGATNGGFDFQEGVDVQYNGQLYYYTTAAGNRTHIAYFLKRATGFMDVVAYSGTSSARTQAHGLTVIPELIITKTRSGGFTRGWAVYHASLYGSNQIVFLESNAGAVSDAIYQDGVFTATDYKVSIDANVNNSSNTYVAYLFATLAGVSKVGSYTGTGSDLNVDCGFSAGARFILIKRTDSTGDWYYWDSARGIIAGNDPYQLMNSTAAEVTNTDYIDPLSSGFTVTSSAPAALNASGGTYIFLSIA